MRHVKQADAYMACLKEGSEAQLANNSSGREFHIEIALGKNEF